MILHHLNLGKVPLRRFRYAQRSLTTFNYTLGKSGIYIEPLNQTFPYVWLRDSCQSSACVHPSTRQKLHRSSDVSLDVCPLQQNVIVSDTGVDITWIDGHRSHFAWTFLQAHSSATSLAQFHKDVHRKPWKSSTITGSADLYIPYDSLGTPSGLLTAINHICEYGILFVQGVPTQETDSLTCELRILAEKFSEIRETFYGRLWDVKNIADSRNIAYTNLDLGLHMDLLYFQNPPQYQILHSLRNRVEGGASIFVDSLYAAERMRAENPSDFTLLTRTLVPFHYINDGHHLHFEHPTIQLAVDGETISQINYSPPFQAPLLVSTPPGFYSALRKFTEYVNDPENTYTYTLKEGDAVIFDNRRVLHARTAFNAIPGTEDGGANRWLKGCYIEGDALWDRGRILRGQTTNA